MCDHNHHHGFTMENRPVCIIPGCEKTAQPTGKKGTVRFRFFRPYEDKYGERPAWLCNTHWKYRLAENRGMTIAQFDRWLLEKSAAKFGFGSVIEYQRYCIEKSAEKHGFSKADQYNPISNFRYASKLRQALTSGFRSIREWETHLAHEAGFSTVAEWKNRSHKYLKYRKNYCENIDGRLGRKCTSTIWYSGQLTVDHIDGCHDHNWPENYQTLCWNCHKYKTDIVSEDWKTDKYGNPRFPERKMDLTLPFFSDALKEFERITGKKLI